MVHVYLTLNSCQTNTARRSMNENIITLLDTRPHNKCAITCWCSDKQTCGLLERPAIGDRKESVLDSTDLGCESTLGRAKDTRSNRELRLRATSRRSDNCACEFGTSDPRKGYVELVSDAIDNMLVLKGLRGWFWYFP